MIDLVLDAHRQQAAGIEFEGLAVATQRADPHPFGAANDLVETRHRQTTFFRFAFPLPFQQGWVDERQRPVLFLGHVHHHDAFPDVDLGGGRANARRGVHGFQHVVHQGPNAVVDGFHR